MSLVKLFSEMIVRDITMRLSSLKIQRHSVSNLLKRNPDVYDKIDCEMKLWHINKNIKELEESLDEFGRNI